MQKCHTSKHSLTISATQQKQQCENQELHVVRWSVEKLCSGPFIGYWNTSYHKTIKLCTSLCMIFQSRHFPFRLNKKWNQSKKRVLAEAEAFKPLLWTIADAMCNYVNCWYFIYFWALIMILCSHFGQMTLCHTNICLHFAELLNVWHFNPVRQHSSHRKIKNLIVSVHQAYCFHNWSASWLSQSYHFTVVYFWHHS